MTAINFVVYGDAKPAGSKRAFARRRADGSSFVSVVDANPNSRDWKNAVASAARESYKGPLLTSPIKLSLVFVRVRPAGHYGKNGLRPSAPAWPATRPDCTKLVRGTEDALRLILWKDDAQVCQQIIEKRYGEPACCMVSVEQIDEVRDD